MEGCWRLRGRLLLKGSQQCRTARDAYLETCAIFVTILESEAYCPTVISRFFPKTAYTCVRTLTMPARSSIKFPSVLLFLLIGSLIMPFAGCRPGAGPPAKSSKEYNELVRAFYIGLAALQVGHDVQADSKLAQFTKLAPTEPAGWANWGLLALRQRNFDTAAERLAACP